MSGLGTTLTSRPLAEVTIDDFEWSAEVEQLLVGPVRWAVRIRYRQRSTRGKSRRHWTSFLLLPPQSEPFAKVAETLEWALLEHFRNAAGVDE